MDPITLLATASAIWSGLKKASEFAQEAEGVWSQLSKYCGVADQLEEVINKQKNEPKKPKLFAKPTLSNDTQEAFDAFQAELKMRQIETEIREMFVVGDWASLPGEFGGMDGYRKFCNMRREIRQRRIKAKQDQEAAEQAFWDNLILWVGGATIVGIGSMVVWFAVSAIINRGV